MADFWIDRYGIAQYRAVAYGMPPPSLTTATPPSLAECEYAYGMLLSAGIKGIPGYGAVPVPNLLLGCVEPGHWTAPPPGLSAEECRSARLLAGYGHIGQGNPYLLNIIDRLCR